MKTYGAIIILITLIPSGFGQFDTIVRYNFVNEKIEKLSPHVTPDSLAISVNTEGKAGTEASLTWLEHELSDSLQTNPSFTDHLPASEFYNVLDYPVSTVVKLGYMHEDTLRSRCSGLLVSGNLVLTAAHCIYYRKKDDWMLWDWREQLIAYPAFDKGQESNLFNSSIATDYFIFNSWYAGNFKDDIALIRLKYPIGIKTGWLGLGYNLDSQFLDHEIFHTFSYPASVDRFDSSKVYDGDQMIYKFGKLESYDNSSINIGINGISGESGSSIIYTNNDQIVYSLGVRVRSFRSQYYRINPSNFPALEYIVEEYGYDNLIPHDSIPTALSIYPNPFYDFMYIESPPLTKIKSISLYNPQGHHLIALHQLFKEAYQFDGSSLSPGIYFMRVVLDDNSQRIHWVIKQ